MSLMRWARGCPPAWQITRALSEESDPIQDHITTCTSCAAEYGRLREVVVRAGLLVVNDPMSTDARQEISARLLAGPDPAEVSGSLSRRLLRRPLAVALVCAGAGAAVLALGMWGSAGGERRTAGVLAKADMPGEKAPASPAASGRSLATVRAIGAARFTRIAPPPDERVQLQEGIIALDVVALQAGERFRVVTEDGEVEVRGTHFEVSASRGRLAAVRVSSGRVQVRSAQGALAILDAGDEWVGGASAESVAVSPPSEAPRKKAVALPSPSPLPLPSATGTPAPSVSTPGLAPRQPLAPAPLAVPPPAASVAPPPTRSAAATTSFDRAWALLRAGDARGAAAAFATVERAAGSDSLAEDAAYWRAVAVARSGDAGTARGLFASFVSRYPASARTGEASVALGWLLLEAGHSADARAAFERASSDPAAPVRASAREGLSRISPPQSGR